MPPKISFVLVKIIETNELLVTRHSTFEMFAFTPVSDTELQYCSSAGVKSSLFIESYSTLVDHNKGKNTPLHLEIQVYNSSAYIPMRMVKSTQD